MTQTLRIEVDFPQIEEVQAPVSFSTAIGVVRDETRAIQITKVIQYLIRQNINQVIQECPSAILEMVVRGAIEQWDYNIDYFERQKIVRFFSRFVVSSGLTLPRADEIVMSPCGNGTRYKLAGVGMTFATYQEAIEHYISIKVTNKQYELVGQ